MLLIELQMKILKLQMKLNKEQDDPALMSFLKVQEELAEVTVEFLKIQGIKRNPKDDVHDGAKEIFNLGNEIADSIISLISLANDYQLNIDWHIERKFKIHQKRQEEKEKQ